MDAPISLGSYYNRTIAQAAERTRHIRLGTGVVSLPYQNPFILADRMVRLDYQTRERAMFGIGPGSLVHDAKKQGIVPANQRRMMNEGLDVIVELMRRETIARTTGDAIAFIERLLKATGGFGVIMELAQNWADWQQTKRHYESMARFVPPHFQGTREWRTDSYNFARPHREAFMSQSHAAIRAEIDKLAEQRRATAD